MRNHMTTVTRQDASSDPPLALPMLPELSVLVPTRNEAGNIEELLLAKAERDGADLVVASRSCGQGRTLGFGPLGALISTASTSAARVLFPSRLGGITDPMSGFFLVRPDVVDVDALCPRGFKILLELLVRCPDLRRAEVGFTFADRHTGQSKGSLSEGLSYLRTLGELCLGLEPLPSRPAAAVPAVEPLVPLMEQAGTA